MQRPKISLCMIVKNEAEDLPRCLESVREVADEIIVVDTGSTDGTVDVALGFGAHVIHFPWQNDFAQARNAGLEAASGDWILFLDADEALDAGDRGKLLECAWHTRYDGFFFRVFNYVGDGHRGTSINPVLRMFRNAKAHRFEGRIHEQIAASICRVKPDAAFHYVDVKIHHYGYLSNRIASRNKVSRNLELLKKTLEESPENPFHLYNIGIEYLRIGQKEQALDAFRRARMLASPAWSYTHLLYKCEARTLQALGRNAQAIQICDEGISLYPAYTDLYHIKGTCEIAMGQMNEAKVTLYSAYKLGPAAGVFHTEEGMGTYQTCYALGLLHESLPDYRAAAAWYLEAMRAKPSLNPPLYRLFRYMKCRGRQKELAGLMARHFRPESTEAAEKIVNMLLSTGCSRAAKLLLRKWKPMLSDAVYARSLLMCHLLCGDPEAAGRSLRRLERCLRPQTYQVLQRMKDWIGWAQTAENRPAVPAQCTPDEYSLAMKIASAANKSPLNLWNQWKQQFYARKDWNPLEAQRLIRAVVDLADLNLERLSGTLSPEQKGLVRACRMAAPFEDGF
jgi:glycosyltransferase involved in cell wall biosynthesis